MVIIVKVIGVIVLIMGVVYLLSPKTMRQYIDFWGKGKRIYGGAVISFVFGILLLSVAAKCEVSGIITLFGILGILKAIVLLALGPAKTAGLIEWWSGRTDSVLRAAAIMVLVVGALLIYAA